MERQRVEYVLETLKDPIKLHRKLLPLVEECGKLSEKSAFGWALLAKLIYACDQEMLQTISSRIQKRLIVAAKQPVTAPLLHFVRSFLVRFPWLKSFNEQTFAYIFSCAVDFSVESCSEDITRLTSNIYALWAGTKYDYILIKTLKNMLSDVTVEEKDDNEKILFRFETALQRYLPQFISTIFNLHTEVMEKCSPDDKIFINEWLDVACESATILEVEKKNSIFRWLKTFLLKAKSCAHLAIQRISSFISDCCYPSKAYYEAVKQYVQLGPNLSLNALFRVLIRSARCQLNSQFQEYGKAYAEALGMMLELRPYLLDVQDIIELQHLICQEAFQNRNCRPALSLLNSLLAMNNELVPSPVQIAQSIFNNSENWCDEVRLGRALCSSISRPRIQIIICQENILKKLSDIVMNGQQINSNVFQNSSKLTMLKNSELQFNDTEVSNEVNDNPIENHENIRTELAGSVVRKRVYPSPENAILKHVRIGFEHGEEVFSIKSESSQSLGVLKITDEVQISNKMGCVLIEQKELRDAAVVDTTAKKINSNAAITVLDKSVDDCQLTIQQIMADFVPA
ncbi:Cytidylate kinase [Dirofilaria immitis]